MKLIKDFLNRKIAIKAEDQVDSDMIIALAYNLRVYVVWTLSGNVFDYKFEEGFPIYSMSKNINHDGRPSNEYFFLNTTSSVPDRIKVVNCKEFFWELAHDNLYGLEPWELII